MKEIVIVEKPDNVSWEIIRETLVEAHRNNLAKGLVVRSTTLTAKQLASQVGDGKCYIALDGERVVGVAAVLIRDCTSWFCHGKVAHFLLDSVLPEYQGYKIYSKLQEKRYKFVKDNHINIITTNTAATNKRMINMLPKHGFHQAVLFKVADIDHFSIIWVKWLTGEPSTIVRWWHYIASAIKTMAIYIKNKMTQK